MYIKSVIVDGFKSYAQRTEIHGFDPQFNAITGLNGSGKSNILDSICFLLGITNLSQVRAGNLQDLVYKSGQAGVTKATVSIVFDNSDKTQSPYGYDQFDELTITRQIVLGGRNKYLINGTNATNNRVQDLFRSVQLNVNNPHFLIMQGRITKVLNMKPPEILSLLEEASSTKLYEHKKENALKTIEKKDSKLKEIERVLREDINPTLAKLRDERKNYLEYQKIMRLLEHLTKLCVAYQYKSYEDLKQKTKEDLVEMQNNLEQAKVDFKKMGEDKLQYEQDINELCRERDEHQGGALTELEQAFSDCQKEEALVQGTVQRAKEAVKTEQKRQTQLSKQDKDRAQLQATKMKELTAMQGDFDKLQRQAQDDETAYTAAQKHLQDVNSGLATNEDGAAASLEEQLRTAQNEAAAADTERKASEMRVKHLVKEVGSKEAEVKRTNNNFAREEETKTRLTRQLNELERQMNQLHYTEGADEKLADEHQHLSREVRSLRDRVDDLSGRLPNLNFEYADPQPRFDRRRVKGMVARLFTIQDPTFAPALEKTAGGKLYNVIVDTEQTGKLLLDHGQLRRRTTMLPLNKMRSSPIPPNIVQKAQRLVGADKVWAALSLVNYDPELQPAMEFVLGGAFICTDLDTAKKVAFHPEIQRKTVTLEGDVFDPQGTLSGGSRSQNASLLLSLAELKEAEERMTAARDRYAQVDRELGQIRQVSERWHDTKQKADQTRHELDLLQQTLQQTDFHRLNSEIEACKKEIDELKVVINEAQSRFTKCRAKATSVQNKIANAAAEREREIKEAETKVSQAKKKAEKSTETLASRQTLVESLQLEIDELGKEADVLKAQHGEIESALQEAQRHLEEQQEVSRVTRETLEAAKAKLAEQRNLIQKASRLIQEKQVLVKQLSKDLANTELKIDEMERKIQMQIRDSKDAGQKLEEMVEAYPWIPEERRHFGQPGSTYDFEQNDPKEAQRRVAKLKEKRDKLSRVVNMRAMNMLGSAEEQYNELVRKQKIVMDDKNKIQNIIDQLDKKKAEALLKAYNQVNKDFNTIFSTLLPGSKAKLVPPEGQTVLDGLEFKIGFGDVWKESLGELSGGQRSLVALSLILSLLLFKPAPLYILDEVDAALDLSHTQNIGQLIKNHFQHSQFIVVSLKDGMFNNANVLFKTKFVDGVSTVTRHVPNQTRPMAVKNTNIMKRR